MNADGANERRLTKSLARVRDPELVAGRTVDRVREQPEGPDQDLYLIHPNGRGLARNPFRVP